MVMAASAVPWRSATSRRQTVRRSGFGAGFDSDVQDPHSPAEPGQEYEALDRGEPVRGQPPLLDLPAPLQL